VWRVKGRLFVAVQGVLLAALVLLPRWADEWTLPGWTAVVGWVVAIAGAVVAFAAFPQLGNALTPLPEPRSDAALTTSGLYRWVRHPIYSGVLAMGWGWTLAHPSWATVVVVVALTVLFHAKARYEEGLLAERYPDYVAYASSTPRFLPRPTSRRRD
jgi:protein-S-isoprenylcysteine O-methyltransferase Ste14